MTPPVPQLRRRRRLLPGQVRARLIEQLRTLVWVVPLTLLIWVYAERAQVTTQPDVSFSIRIRSTDPSRAITLLRPADRTVVITMEGPRARIEAVRQQITDTSGQRSGVALDIGAGISPGEVSRPAVDLFNDLAIFRSNGIKVTAVRPPELLLRVDPVAEVEAVVVAGDTQTGAGLSFEGDPVFDPPSVKVRAPQRVLEAWLRRDATGRTTVAADLGGNPLLRVPGPHELKDVLIARPADADDAVLVTPPRVTCTVRVRQSVEAYTIPSMPVFPLAPAKFLDEYAAGFDPVITNVRVTGPPDRIDALRRETLVPKPKAMLEFGREDLPAGQRRSRRVRFDLPEGITLAPDDARREVEFTLTARKSPEER